MKIENLNEIARFNHPVRASEPEITTQNRRAKTRKLLNSSCFRDWEMAIEITHCSGVAGTAEISIKAFSSVGVDLAVAIGTQKLLLALYDRFIPVGESRSIPLSLRSFSRNEHWMRKLSGWRDQVWLQSRPSRKYQPKRSSKSELTIGNTVGCSLR
jgi:hypothetical protein